MTDTCFICLQDKPCPCDTETPNYASVPLYYAASHGDDHDVVTAKYWQDADDRTREWYDTPLCKSISYKGLVNVSVEDANNYCRILTLLGMEEEGDPVNEIARLLEISVSLEPAIPQRADGKDGKDGS